MNNQIDLLNEASALMTVLTGNLSDESLSLDDGRVRQGMSLILVEVMKRIDAAMATIADVSTASRNCDIF